MQSLVIGRPAFRAPLQCTSCTHQPRPTHLEQLGQWRWAAGRDGQAAPLHPHRKDDLQGGVQLLPRLPPREQLPEEHPCGGAWWAGVKVSEGMRRCLGMAAVL